VDEGLDNWARGDWSASPWFALEEDEIFAAMGFSLEARRDAALHLKRVFTPDVCREIGADPKRGYGSAIALFQRCWPGLLIPLLEVGRDLGTVEPWGDPALLKRLTRRATFHDTAFELRVLANLVRAGYRAQRIPEAPPRRTPDLGVQVGLDTYELELKAVSDSPLDEAADVVSEALVRAEVIVAGLHLELRGSESLSTKAFENLNAVLTETPKIVAAFEACSAGIRQAGGKPGVYQVPEYGAIHAIPGPAGGSVTPVVLPDLPAAKRINKLVRLVRDASRQFTQRRGITVLGVRRSAEMLDVSDAIKAAAAHDSSAFAKCHMVVLVDSVRDPVRDYGSIPLALPVQVHARRQISRAQERLAAIAAGRAGRDAHFVRHARPGESGLRMGAVRRAMTSTVIGPDGKFDANRALPGVVDLTTRTS
jgi:hypothetical protein